MVWALNDLNYTYLWQTKIANRFNIGSKTRQTILCTKSANIVTSRKINTRLARPIDLTARKSHQRKLNPSEAWKERPQPLLLCVWQDICYCYVTMATKKDLRSGLRDGSDRRADEDRWIDGASSPRVSVNNMQHWLLLTKTSGYPLVRPPLSHHKSGLSGGVALHQG